MAARTQSIKKSFQTGTGTNPAFYMYERRYATEPFTAVEPSAPVDWAFGPRGAERADAAWFRLCVDNVQERRQLRRRHGDGCASTRTDHSIRKDLGLASGRERPPREGRGADFRAAEGGRSRPRCIRRSSVDERYGRHRAPSAADRLRHRYSRGRMTYDFEPPLASDGIG